MRKSFVLAVLLLLAAGAAMAQDYPTIELAPVSEIMEATILSGETPFLVAMPSVYGVVVASNNGRRAVGAVEAAAAGAAGGDRV